MALFPAPLPLKREGEAAVGNVTAAPAEDATARTLARGRGATAR
jgi:hypothetical protein